MIFFFFFFAFRVPYIYACSLFYNLHLPCTVLISPVFITVCIAHFNFHYMRLYMQIMSIGPVLFFSKALVRLEKKEKKGELVHLIRDYVLYTTLYSLVAVGSPNTFTMSCSR